MPDALPANPNGYPDAPPDANPDSRPAALAVSSDLVKSLDKPLDPINDSSEELLHRNDVSNDSADSYTTCQDLRFHLLRTLSLVMKMVIAPYSMIQYWK
ncbi:hypothetical protein B9Z55_025133 [Caenorhabditis nigoni]|uniref:Uncharacterized protein n=1 Tax=Caenorhabditis nigoni TaxID=1611254 RepID=A0A2G5SXS9_9PELO|nr:hypothetical protein B9Z55_025133 [Caenorhabditis nigoni]